MSSSLPPHGLQHSRLPCPSPSPGACSNSCPLSQWYHPTISSSVAPFSFCPWPSPASGSFPVSHLFTSRSLCIRPSASASALPMNIQGWLPSGLTGFISLQSKGLSRAFPSTTVRNYQFFGISLLYRSTLTSIHDDWKNHSFDCMDICWQKWCLCFLICSLGMS